MREVIIQRLQGLGLSPELTVFIVAMLPVIELRGALPVGINLYQMAWSKTLLIALFGNIFPIPFILLFLERIANLLSRWSIFARFFDWLFTRTRRKSKLLEEYKFWGLVIFVAIPLPGTGAWTGAVAAFLLGMDFKLSLLAITLGVIFAGIFVTSLCLLGIWGAILVATALLIFAVVRILKKYATLRQSGNRKGSS